MSSWVESICRPTTGCQKVPGSRKKRLRPPIMRISHTAKKMPTSGRQNFFMKVIIWRLVPALSLALRLQNLEIPIHHRFYSDGGERRRRSSNHKHKWNGRSLAVAFDSLAASDSDKA